MGECPFDDGRILSSGGDIVIAAEQKYRVADHGEDGEQANECEEFQHGRISGLRAGWWIVTRNTRKKIRRV